MYGAERTNTVFPVGGIVITLKEFVHRSPSPYCELPSWFPKVRGKTMGHERFALGTNFGKYFDCTASPRCQRRVSRCLSASSKPILSTQPSVRAGGGRRGGCFRDFSGNEAATC